MVQREDGRSVTLPVFLAPLDGVQIGDQIELGGAEGRHAKTVRRIGVGKRLEIVDGCGGRVSANVQTITDSGLLVQVLTVVWQPAPSPAVTLVQALAKGGRDEMAVEICTELGVDRIIPWQADRSIVHWVGARGEKSRQKWSNQVISAAKQSRRALFPPVSPVVTSPDLAAIIQQVVTDGGLVLVCHEEATEPILRVINASPTAGTILILVGPEGGISPEESDAFIAVGARLVTLGPNVLRSSTAGAVGVMAVNLGRNR